MTDISTAGNKSIIYSKTNKKNSEVKAFEFAKKKNVFAKTQEINCETKLVY